MDNYKLVTHLFKNRWIILFTCMLVIFSCGEKDDNKKPGGEYDPKKPIELMGFYPDSGWYQEKVMLEGKNFGTDPTQIRVWFNQKRAPVIGSTGSRIYVQAPRLPGDTCTISVVVGNDSVVYDKTFRYFASVTVTTIAGTGESGYQDGDLTTAKLSPRYVCVDEEDNIFVMCRYMDDQGNTDYHAVSRVDQEANELITIEKGLIGNVPVADPETGIITFPTEATVGSIYTLDPKEFWGPRKRELKFPDSYPNKPANGYKHALAFNPEDGYIYCRYYYGDIIKIDPKSYEVELVYKTVQGDNFGLTFNPLEPNILYMSFHSNGGVCANSICSIDVTNPDETFKKLSGPTGGGFRDGPLETAQFNQPNQIMCDADGNIYVADKMNHCIRRITPEKMVETVLGFPQTAGFKDGTKDEALFNKPTGIGISKDGTVYVGDNGNRRLRKLSIN